MKSSKVNLKRKSNSMLERQILPRVEALSCAWSVSAFDAAKKLLTESTVSAS
jgi:hypothetical protein